MALYPKMRAVVAPDPYVSRRGRRAYFPHVVVTDGNGRDGKIVVNEGGNGLDALGEDGMAGFDRLALLFAAAPELLEALDDLLVFHSPTHPRHEALHEQYAESCIANEISFSSATLLDDLVRAASTAIAKATGAA